MSRSVNVFRDLARRARTAWKDCLRPDEVPEEVTDALAYIPELCLSLEEAGERLALAQKEIRELRKLKRGRRRRRRQDDSFEPLPAKCYSLSLPKGYVA